MIDPPGSAVELRAKLSLISLDFESLDELFEGAAARELGWVEVFLNAIEADDDLSTIDKWRDGGIRVASVSSLAKLSQATEADLPEHMRLVERSIELAERVGAPAVTFMFGSQPDLGPVAARDRFLRRLEPLVLLAEKRGVRILIENVFSRGSAGDLDTVEALVALFERVDPRHVRLNFDPANLTIAGSSGYPDGYRALRAYIGSLHLKDVRPLHDDDHPLGTRRVMEAYERGSYLVVPLGEGDLDVAGLLEELKHDALDVVVSLEPTAQRDERERWLDASLTYLANTGIISDRSGRSFVTEVVRP